MKSTFCLLINVSFRKTLESFSRGNLEFNYFKDFYRKCQEELDLRKHMMTTNQLVDCLFSLLSYGTPSIPFLLSLGKELGTRKFSPSNFQHTNRMLKACVLLKSYFKDPIFILDQEWKDNAYPLFKTYQNVYLLNLSPIIEQQSIQFKQLSFNPRLYFENLGLVCFLNGVFQVNENLQHLIVQCESVIQYYCLWYGFFKKHHTNDHSLPLLESHFSLDSPSNIQVSEQIYEPQSSDKSKSFFWNKLPRQLDLEDLFKIVYSSQKGNYQIFQYENLLDFFSSNLLRIGICFYFLIFQKNII